MAGPALLIWGLGPAFIQSESPGGHQGQHEIVETEQNQRRLGLRAWLCHWMTLEESPLMSIRWGSSYFPVDPTGLLWGSSETRYMKVLRDLASALLVQIHRMIVTTAGKTLWFRARTKGPGPGLTSQPCIYLTSLYLYNLPILSAYSCMKWDSE